MMLPFVPSWAKALAAVALAALVGLAIYGYGRWQYARGEQAERAAWQQRENAELTAANARIVELSAAYRAREQQHAADLASASATYQESLQHEKATHDRTLVDLRSGALRLRVPLARRQTAAGERAAEAGAGAGRCDGETHAELSVAASEFLVGLASEADEVVHQLAACQAVVTADRKP